MVMPAAQPRAAGVVRRCTEFKVGTSRAIDKREACPRRALAAAVERSGQSYAALSRMLDRPGHYLRRFVVDGHPRALREDEHRRLARFFGLDDRGLGVRDLWARHG